MYDIKIRGIGFKQIPHYFYVAKSAEKAHIRNKDVSLANNNYMHYC